MEQQPMGISIEQSVNVRYSGWVREALDELPHSFTITDLSILGHPIIFASREFLKMSGYSTEEVIGKNGRMFQGIKTNRRSVMEIREAIREERSVQVTLLNYQKDGTPFWIWFHMFPAFNKEDGRVIHFVGVQVPIMPKPRRFGSEFSRIEVNLCENGAGLRDAVPGFCRREVLSDTMIELPRISNLDSVLADDHTESRQRPSRGRPEVVQRTRGRPEEDQRSTRGGPGVQKVDQRVTRRPPEGDQKDSVGLHRGCVLGTVACWTRPNSR